jgi:hypothetical protein
MRIPQHRRGAFPSVPSCLPSVTPFLLYPGNSPFLDRPAANRPTQKGPQADPRQIDIGPIESARPWGRIWGPKANRCGNMELYQWFGLERWRKGWQPALAISSPLFTDSQFDPWTLVRPLRKARLMEVLDAITVLGCLVLLVGTVVFITYPKPPG